MPDEANETRAVRRRRKGRIATSTAAVTACIRRGVRPPPCCRHQIEFHPRWRRCCRSPASRVHSSRMGSSESSRSIVSSSRAPKRPARLLFDRHRFGEVLDGRRPTTVRRSSAACGNPSEAWDGTGQKSAHDSACPQASDQPGFGRDHREGERRRLPGSSRTRAAPTPEIRQQQLVMGPTRCGGALSTLD
jgi:hypothetical protein